MKILLLSAALLLTPVADTQHSITLHDGKVTMSLHTFRGIATIIAKQRKMIEMLSKELDDETQRNMDIEDCVRQNAGDNKAVTTCFGDKEM